MNEKSKDYIKIKILSVHLDDNVVHSFIHFETELLFV